MTSRFGGALAGPRASSPRGRRAAPRRSPSTAAARRFRSPTRRPPSRSSRRPTRKSRSTTAAAAAARAVRIWPTWSSTSRAPTRPSRRRSWPRSRAARCSTSRSCSAPSRSATTLEGVDKLQLSAETLAKIFQRDIKKWNDKAIAADNPGAKLPGHGHRGRPPGGRLGHHPELHRIPERRRQGHLEAQERLDGRVAQRHAGRTGQRRRRPDREVDQGRDRLRRPVGREGLGPEVRQRQEPGRQIRRADHRGAPRPPARASRSRTTCCSARSTPRATRPIPSPARPG